MSSNEKSFRFRKASINDFEMLQSWDKKEHVRKAIQDGNWDWEVELKKTRDWREQLIALVNDIPIGFLQIIDPYEEESSYWGELKNNFRAIDIWIGEEDFLNKGYGTLMMTEALDRCFSSKEVEEILVDPYEDNIDAIRFFERLGFSYKEYRLFEGEEGPVYSLRREKWLSS